MISSAELAEKEFTGISLPDPYRSVLGKLPPNFSLVIWGPPGSGKSTVAVDFAWVLANTLGKGIYCSSEEGAGPSMQDKIKRLKAEHPDLYVKDFDGMEDLKSAIKYGKAKFCIFDSASMSHIKVSEMEDIHDFCKKAGVAFIFILHATKAGDFKGNSYLVHMPDTVLKVEEGIAKTTKNRFADTPQEFEVSFETKDRENPGLPDKILRINPNDPEYYGIDFIDPEFQEDVRENRAPTPDELYETITNQIVELMESGKELPWQKPWHSNRNFPHSLPTNFVSKKAYRGINRFMLMFTRIVKNEEGKKVRVLGGFDHPYYLTAKQIDKLGGRIKEGGVGQYAFYFNLLYAYNQDEPKLDFSTTDKGHFISWAKKNWNQISIAEVEGKTPEEFAENNIYPLLRYYNIFNGSDIDGIDFGELEKPQELSESERIKAGELIVENYPNPPEVEFEGDQPAYYPKQDIIKMTEFKQFKDAQKYYSVFFHELSHSTGHSSRLDRGNDTRVRDGSEEDKKAYKFEELVAEMSAAFLCAEAGILFHTREMTAGYLKGYKEALARYMKGDDKFFFQATSRAQAATDHILDRDENGVPAYIKEFNESLTQKDVDEPKVGNYPFSAEDIPYQLAYDAHSGTSFSPDKRAVSEQNSYYGFLKDVYDTYQEKADKQDRLEEFKANFNRYQKGYLKRYKAYLQSKVGIFSTMIAGPSNFPVRKMQKKNEVSHKRLNELVDYQDKAGKYILKDPNTDIKTGQEGSLEKLEAKLAKLEAQREANKAFNKIVRKYNNEKKYSPEQREEGIRKEGAEAGFSEKVIQIMLEGDQLPSYASANLSSNIRRVKQQIKVEKKLAKLRDQGNKEIPFPGGEILLNYEINKIQIFFDEKPDVEVRNFLKQSGHAFKWSPKNKVWQRQLNTYYGPYQKDLYALLGVETVQSSKASETKESNAAGTEIYFDTKKPVPGQYDIIEAKDLIPSHNKDCSQNSKHVISKAQPRDRSGVELCNQSKLMAQNLNPDLITIGNKAFDGAPVMLPDGQVIQGNGRSIALKIAYDEFKKQADNYRNHLLKNASKFGLTRDFVEGFKQPVLVRKVDVSESEAIRLGNIVDTSQAKMNRLDQAKAYIRQLDEQKRQIIGRIINSSSGETLGEIIDDKGLMVMDQLKGLDRTGLVQDNALTGDGKDFIRQLFSGLVFDSDDNKDALKHFAKLLHNTKAGIERSYGFIIPFIGSKRNIAPTLQKSIEIVQAIQNNESMDTISDFLTQGDAFTGINRDRFSEKEIKLAEFLLPQKTQKAIKEAFQVYYFKNIGRNDLLNPVEKVSPDQAFQDAFVEQVRINPPEELVKLYTPSDFKKGDIVRDYYDNEKYKMTSKRKETYYFKNLRTGKREKFRKSDKRFLHNRDVTPTLSLFRENPGVLAYMGITEKVIISSAAGLKELEGKFPTFLAGDKLYIVPKNRVQKIKNKVNDKAAFEAFEQFNNYSASDTDYKIDLPDAKSVSVGTAKKIWYASDKVIQEGDKKGKTNHYVHEFDAGKRPAIVKGDVLIIGNIEWDARGLLN